MDKNIGRGRRAALLGRLAYSHIRRLPCNYRDAEGRPREFWNLKGYIVSGGKTEKKEKRGWHEIVTSNTLHEVIYSKHGNVIDLGAILPSFYPLTIHYPLLNRLPCRLLCSRANFGRILDIEDAQSKRDIVSVWAMIGKCIDAGQSGFR